MAQLGQVASPTRCPKQFYAVLYSFERTEVLCHVDIVDHVVGRAAGAYCVACTNKKSVNPLAGIGSKQPDKVLFDRAMDAMKHNRFDVARITLQTLDQHLS